LRHCAFVRVQPDLRCIGWPWFLYLPDGSMDYGLAARSAERRRTGKWRDAAMGQREECHQRIWSHPARQLVRETPWHPDANVLWWKRGNLGISQDTKLILLRLFRCDHRQALDCIQTHRQHATNDRHAHRTNIHSLTTYGFSLSISHCTYIPFLSLVIPTRASRPSTAAALAWSSLPLRSLPSALDQ